MAVATMARILIIDDSAAICESLAYFFESEGHSVMVADNGSEGLRRAAERPVDVVLLDVEMPGMSGFEVCRAMRDDPALCKLSVVMMTGHTLRAIGGSRPGGGRAARRDQAVRPGRPPSDAFPILSGPVGPDGWAPVITLNICDFSARSVFCT